MEKEEEAKETMQGGSSDDGAAEGTSEKVEEETKKTVEVEETEDIANNQEVEVIGEAPTGNLEASEDVEDIGGVQEETTSSEKMEDADKEMGEEQEVEIMGMEVPAGTVEANQDSEDATGMKEETTNSEKVGDADKKMEERQEVENEIMEVPAVNLEANQDLEDTAGVTETTSSEKVEDVNMEPKDNQQEVKVGTTETADVDSTKTEQQEKAADVEEGRVNTAGVQAQQDVTHVEANGVKTTGAKPISDVKKADMDQKETVTVAEQSTHVEEGKAGVEQPAHTGSTHLPTVPTSLNDETESNNSDPEFFNFDDFEVVDALEDDDEEEEEEDGGGDRTRSPSRQRHSQRSPSHKDSSRSRYRRRSHSRERSRRGRDSYKDSRDKGSSSSRSSRTSSRYKDDRGHHTHSRDRRKEEERVSDRSRYRQRSPRRTHSKDDEKGRFRSSRKDASSSSSRKESSTTSRKDAPSSTPSSAGSRMETSSSTPKEESSSSTSTKDTSSSISKEEPASSSPKVDTSSSTSKEGASSLSPKEEAPPSTSGQERGTTGHCPNKPLSEAPSESNSTREGEDHKGLEGISSTPSVAAEQRETESENQDRDTGKIEIAKEENVKKDDVTSEVNNTEVQPNCKTVEVKNEINEYSKDSQGNTDPAMTLKSSNINVEKDELGSNTSIKCELDNLEVQSEVESCHTNVETQPHSKMEILDGNDSEADNKGLEPAIEDSEVSSNGLTPQNNEPATKGKEEGSKVEPQRTKNIKSVPSKRTKCPVMKELKTNRTEPPEAKKGKTEAAPTRETTENQETGIATRTRSRRGTKTPVVAVRRVTRSRKKMVGAKEEATKGTTDQLECETGKEESKEVENIVKEETEAVQEEKANVEQEIEDSDKATSPSNSTGNLIVTEDIKEESSNMEQANEDVSINGEEKLDLIPQEDSDDIKPQISHQENTETPQYQDEAGTEDGNSQDKKEDRQRHANLDSIQENSTQINQKEENELRATQSRSIEEPTLENDKEGLTRNIDGDIKVSTDPAETEDEKNKRLESSTPENTVRKEIEKEEVTSKMEDGDINKDTESMKTQEDKRPQDVKSESEERKRKNTEVSSHEKKKARKEDNTGLKDKQKQNNDIGKGKTDEARAVTKGEAKLLGMLLKDSSSKKLGRYSKVVVVGDTRISLLDTPDIKEQLKGGTQVLVVPELTLTGLVNVVKKEVVEAMEKQLEERSRGVLLLCLAGLHGTLVKLQTPDECEPCGDSAMKEMVCAVSDDSLDPKFSKSLTKIKRNVQEALGNGSRVLFFPVLPVDITNYNAIQAKQHFEATGHKLSQRSDVETLHYRALRQYKDAISKVNDKSHGSLSLVPFDFNFKSSCRRFTDELLQDGYMPTLDLVERHILPQLQRTIKTATVLRFPQVVLVGDQRLCQVVTMQQEEGVEPCTFILQEQMGLKSLTAGSPVVKQLSGLSRALIILTVSLADLTPPGSTLAPDSKKAKCRIPHSKSEAMNQFVQEAKRVDQLLGSVTHHCTIITTPIMPFDNLMVTKGREGKGSQCYHCRETVLEVKRSVMFLTRTLCLENDLPNWNLNFALQRFQNRKQGGNSSRRTGQKDRSSKQGKSLESWLVKEASSTWENYLHNLQKIISTPSSATITSIFQNPKHLAVMVPQDKDTRSAHRRGSKDREHTHSSHSTHSRSKDRRRRERSRSRQKSPALDDITSPASSPVSEKQSKKDLDSISSGEINFPSSPSQCSINSPENFIDSSPSPTSNNIGENRPLPPQVQSATECPSLANRVLLPTPFNVGPPPTSNSRDVNRHIPPLLQLSTEPPPSVKRTLLPTPLLWTVPPPPVDGLEASHYPQGNWERPPSTHRYPSPTTHLGRGRSRSRSRSRGRSISRRSRSPKEITRGRVSRSASPAWVPHNSKRPLYRQSLSPLKPHRSTSRGRRSASRGKSPVSRIRSISRGRRSLSRGRRSLSRGRRSVSRGRRSTSRGRRSISRGRSPLRSKGSISRRSISRGARSLSRGKRSVSRRRSPVSRARRSFSRGRRSHSRGRRSFSRGRRSVSRGRSISRGRRSISRGRRSISRGRRSISRGRRSISRGRRSISRGRRGRSSSRDKPSSASFPSQQDKSRENMISDALRTLRSVHEKECEMYRNNPNIHPDIGAEYARYCEKKTQSILALGGDPLQYNMAEEWRVFWVKRIEEIFIESWRIKMDQCLDALEAHKKLSPPPCPSLKPRHSYSPSLSSDSSHSDTQSWKKRKRRKRMRRSSSLEVSKRKRKAYDGKLSAPKSYTRDRAVERSPVVNERRVRSPEHPRGHLSKKQERSEDQEPDYPVTRIPDMSRARQEESVTHQERETSIPPESVEKDGQGRRSQENLKEQVQKHNSSPLSMSQMIREAWGQNTGERQSDPGQSYYPSPPRISERQQVEQSKRYKQVQKHLSSPPSISQAMKEAWDQHTAERQNEQSQSYYPTPPRISENQQKEQSKRYYSNPTGMSAEEECWTARSNWHQSSSPSDHRTTHSDPQPTIKHSIRDFNPMNSRLPDARNVVDEIREVGEQLEEVEANAPTIVRDLWLQLSGKKSSDGPDVTAESEGQSHKPYQDTVRQKARTRDCQARQNDASQEARAREGQAQRDGPTHPGKPRDVDSFLSHSHSHKASKEAQEAYSSHSSEKQSITDIFKSFATEKAHPNASTKSGPHEDEASATTAREETTKIDIDVVNVLEVLTHLGDKLGSLCAPLKLMHQRAEELRTNGTDPIVIMSNSDNKFLLQIIQEKLQGILKDGQLSIIKKVIVQEAEQRLSFLLERQKQYNLLGDLNLSHLARRCLDMDAPTTVAYIREVLLCRGQANPPQDHLMKLYMAVKEEQLKIVRDQHNDQAAAAAAAAFAEELKPTQHPHLLSGRSSAGLPHGAAFPENLGQANVGLPYPAAFAEDPQSASHTHFLGGGANMIPPHSAAITEDPNSTQHTHLLEARASMGPHHSNTFAEDQKPPLSLHILGSESTAASSHAAFSEDTNPSSHTPFSGGGANTAPPNAAAYANYPKPPTHTRFSGSGTNMVPTQAPPLRPSPPGTKHRSRPSRFEPMPLRASQQQLEESSSSSRIRPAPPPPTLSCPVSQSPTSQTWSHPPSHIIEAHASSMSHSTPHSAAHSVAHFPGTQAQATHGEVKYKKPSSKWYVSKKPIRITLPKQQPQKSFVTTFNPLGDDTDSEECE